MPDEIDEKIRQNNLAIEEKLRQAQAARIRAATIANVQRYFTPPAVEDPALGKIRQAVLNCALELANHADPSFELNRAINRLREAHYWARESILCNPVKAST